MTCIKVLIYPDVSTHSKKDKHEMTGKNLVNKRIKQV